MHVLSIQTLHDDGVLRDTVTHGKRYTVDVECVVALFLAESFSLYSMQCMCTVFLT